MSFTKDKALTVILFVIVLVVFPVYAGDFTVSLDTSEYSVANIDGTAVFAGAPTVGTPGHPALPVFTVKFLLPDGANIGSVSASITNLQDEFVTGYFDVIPVPPYMISCDSTPYWPDSASVVDGRNLLEYGRSDFIHSSHLGSVRIEKQKYLKFAVVEIFPFSYNPTSKELKKLTLGDLIVNFNFINSPSTYTVSIPSSISRHDASLIQQARVSIANASDINIIPMGVPYSTYQFRSSSYDNLMIITTNNIFQNSQLFLKYLASKKHRGINSLVVTEDKTYDDNGEIVANDGWGGGYGNNAAENIRNYLLYDNRYYNIDYLLLIGNPHPGGCVAEDVINERVDEYGDICNFDPQDPPLENAGDVPMKWIHLWSGSMAPGFAGKADSHLSRALPTDYYYSYLSISWDTDNDGLAGEGVNSEAPNHEYYAINGKADVTVGRIPVYNNDTITLDNYLSKVIEYENSTKEFSETFRDNFLYASYKADSKTPAFASGKTMVQELEDTYNMSVGHYFIFSNQTVTNTYKNNSQAKLTQVCVANPPKKDCASDSNSDGLCDINNNSCTLVSHLEHYASTPGGNYNDSTITEFGADLSPTDTVVNSIWNRTNKQFGSVIFHNHGGRTGAILYTGGNVENVLYKNPSGYYRNLDDRKPAILFSPGCQTGWPEASYNITNALLRNGAIVEVSPVRDALFDSDTYDYENDRFIEDSALKHTTDGKSYSKWFMVYLYANKESAGLTNEKTREELASFGRNLILYNLYGDATIGIRTWRTNANDNDNDGVADDFDPCPTLAEVTRWGQDLDGDGLSDVNDSDGDNLADICDNCTTVYNPVVFVPPSSELLLAPREGEIFSFIGGAVALGFAFYTRDEMNQLYVAWQPDHDIDGIGDSCDHPGNTFTNKDGNLITADGYGYAYLATPTPVDIGFTLGITGIVMPSWTQYFDAYVKIDQTLLTGELCPISNPLCTKRNKATVHYCGIKSTDRGLWGTDGYCTTANDSQTKYSHKQAYDFGFSHGTDDMSVDTAGRSRWDMRVSWGSSLNTVPNDFKEIGVQYAGDVPRTLVPLVQGVFYLTGFQSNSIYWNWRRDWWERNLCDETPLVSYCQGLKDPLSGYNGDHNFYYTLSSGIYPETTEQRPYLKIQGSSTIINPEYFLNQQKYARSHRVSTDHFTLNYHQKAVLLPIDPPTMEYCPSCYFRIPIESVPGGNNIDPAPYDMSRYYGLWTIKQVGEEILFAHTEKLPLSHVQAFFEVDSHLLYAIKQLDNEYRFMVSYPDHDPDWHDLGTLTGGDQISQLATAVQKDDQFIIIGKSSNPAAPLETIYTVTAEQDGTAMQGDLEVPTFAYTLTARAVTGLDSVAGKRLITVGNEIYLIARDSSSTTLKILDTTSWTFTTISPVLSPSARKNYNVYGTANKIYFVGGIDINGGEPKDIWTFDTQTNEWTQLYNNLTGDLRKLVIEPIDGQLVMVNPILEFHQTLYSAISLNLTDNSISYPIVSVLQSPDYLLAFVSGICLNDTGTILKGGTLAGNFCQPFTHPWYKQYSIGTTVYSVAGKGNRLYVGTGSSIKVYDISDPNALVLKSTFSTSNRIVYDLEVADGDIMYAATSKGLYKLSTADPDTLTIIGSFYSTGSYNYQYRIQLYNNLLYVGDDNGINIRSTTNFARLSYVNIGSTMDFAIANGEIAMYWDAFWDSGIDIRNVDTLARTAWDYPYCSEGELTTDHGAFYLSCDGYEYRFNGLANTYINYVELDGDMREMQENHLYNGWVYIPDGSYVKLSTNNTVPSICGNGIIEPGEFCDGNSEDCATLDPTQWDSGTAYCNSTCTAYDTGDCYDSGC